MKRFCNNAFPSRKPFSGQQSINYMKEKKVYRTPYGLHFESLFRNLNKINARKIDDCMGPLELIMQLGWTKC